MGFAGLAGIMAASFQGAGLETRLRPLIIVPVAVGYLLVLVTRDIAAGRGVTNPMLGKAEWKAIKSICKG